MEQFRSRTSNFASVDYHRSSCSKFRHGNGKVDGRIKFSNWTPDPGPWGSQAADDDSFSCDFGLRSSKQVAASPIKALLAEEMSRETEPKRRSPSVIARLMGFDGLPSQQNSRKQQNRSLENYQLRNVSPDKFQGKGRSWSRSSGNSSKDEQDFKDVFEVSDTLKMKGSNYSSGATTQSDLTNTGIAFVRQKFMDAKRPSSDEKHMGSKEFHDTIEALDSNSDLVVRLLAQPDSLFVKHVHDLQGAAHLPHCSHISAMKLSQGTEYNSDLGYKSERRATCKNQRKYDDGLYNQGQCKHVPRKIVKSSKVPLEGNSMPTMLPTKIVVLKPNLGKLQNASNSVLSPRSSHDFLSDYGSNAEIYNGDEEICGRKRVSGNVGSLRSKSRESRAITKEVARHVKNNLKKDMNISTSRFRGYAGDESSPNMSENESVNESDVNVLTSRYPIHCRSHYRHSSLRSAESSVSREAKKRLSERWKSTHKSIDMGVVSRGSTLGEMLSIPDREARAYSDAVISENDPRDRPECNKGSAVWTEPLGISSKDGWKNECAVNLQRSRSLPSSQNAIGSHKNAIHHEIRCNDKYMAPEDVMQHRRNRVMKGKPNLRESSKPLPKKSYVSYCSSTDSGNSSPEIFSLKELQSSKPKADSLDEDHSIGENFAAAVSDSSSNSGSTIDTEIKNTNFLSKPTSPEVKGYSPRRDHLSASCSQEQSDTSLKADSVPFQCTVAELESLASSKETDQPSPVSVLETSFPNEASSSSECFESLSADLHGLRMQLQLLKLESEFDRERPMLLSSDEDVEECSAGFPERRVMGEESREFLYMLDVLLDSGIDDTDPDTFILTWNSSDCPVSTQVFEELEKKYCSHASWSKSERRLLFDRINSALMMWYRQHEDPHPWVKYSSTVKKPKWIRNELQGCLYKMLIAENKKGENGVLEKILTTETQWLEMGDDIDVIGREIERLLTEEILTELVALV